MGWQLLGSWCQKGRFGLRRPRKLDTSVLKAAAFGNWPGSRQRLDMVRKGTKRRPAPEQDKMIVEALRGVGRPVSAYELIEELRDKATLAPQTSGS